MPIEFIYKLICSSNQIAGAFNIDIDKLIVKSTWKNIWSLNPSWKRKYGGKDIKYMSMWFHDFKAVGQD